MTKRIKTCLLLGASGFVGAIALQATPALAQGEGASGRDSIVVTATRKEQSLQEVPLAVSAIGADELVERNVGNILDLENGTIPGLRLTPFAGTPSVLIANIRGVGLSDTTQGTQELAVPLYIDGIYQGRAQGLGLDLIEPERIEVLRGPQGQLFGRNAEGGAIQLVSKKPTGEFGFDASASYGKFDEQRYRVRLELPEVAGVAVQLSYIHSEYKPLTDNVPDGTYTSQEDYNFSNNDGFRVAARWRPTESFTADYVFDKSDNYNGQPYLEWLDVDLAITAVPGQPEFDGTYTRETQYPVFNEGFDVETLGHTLTLEYELSDIVTLKSLTSYREASRHGSNTLCCSLQAGASSLGFVFPNAREDIDQNQFSQEGQIFATWDNFDLTAGFIYYNEEVDDQRRSYLTGPGLTPGALTDPMLQPGVFFCIATDPCLVSKAVQDAETKSWGGYAQATWTPPILDENLHLTAGLRYSRDRKTAMRVFSSPLAAPPLTEALPSGPLPPAAFFSTERWDPAFTVAYDFTPTVNGYVRYATAYRAGGANVRSSVFSSYDEEELETWEVGLKTQFADGRVTANMAFFHNTITGRQDNIQEAPATNPSLTNTVNSPTDVKNKGFEFESFVNVAEGLDLSFTYAYLDNFEYQEFDNPFTAPVDITRFYAVTAPKHSGAIGASYSTPFGPGELALRADYAFSSHYWTTPGAINTAIILPTYDRPSSKTDQLSARIALREVPIGGAMAEFAVWGRNLTDSTSYTYGFDSAAFGGGFAFFLEQPRMFGGEIRISY